MEAFERRDKINYYLDLAETVAQRCTCLRHHYGAVIVKDDEVVSTGYVGAPRGRANCSDLGYCLRQKLDIPRGQRYELCRLPKGYDRRGPVSHRHGGPGRQLHKERRLLLNVQAPGDKRRYSPGHRPGRQGQL